MILDFKKAIECFQEILNTVNAVSEPEKWNLYAGFQNMALGLKKLAEEIQSN